MAKRTRFEVTDSNGKVHVRTSDCRIYSHAVVTHFKECEHDGRTYPPHSRVEWASRKDLAEKNASNWRGKNHVTGVELLEVRVAQ